MSDLSNLIPPSGGCDHKEILPSPTDPTVGVCTTCGDGSFPLYSDIEEYDKDQMLMKLQQVQSTCSNVAMELLVGHKVEAARRTLELHESVRLHLEYLRAHI